MARSTQQDAGAFREAAVLGTAELIDESPALGVVTARRIAEHLGYSPAALYTHFENLDALFEAVNAHSLAELRRALDETLRRTPRGAAAIHAMARAYLRFARTHPGRYRLVFARHRAAGEAPPPALRREIDALFSRLAAQLWQVAAAADADLLQGCRALWSGVHGIAMLELSGTILEPVLDEAGAVETVLVDRFLEGWSACATLTLDGGAPATLATTAPAHRSVPGARRPAPMGL